MYLKSLKGWQKYLYEARQGVMTEFQIKTLNSRNEDLWDYYVYQTEFSTFYHQTGWKKVIQNTYHHKPYYLYAEDESGKIAGIFPLFYMSSPFFGRRLVSVPFAPYGGICANEKIVQKALIEEAIGIANKLGVDYCEFRNFKPCNDENLSCTTNYSTFLLDVTSGSEKIWSSMNRNVRNRIRKGDKSNLKYETDSNSDGLSNFYTIYSQNMNRLGTPVHNIKFFKNIVKYFPENAFISTVNLDKLPISAFYFLTFKNQLIAAWGATLSSFFNYAPTDFMYWNCVKYASENNFQWVDFGRSLINSGTYIFKTRWGCAEVPLSYYCYPSSRMVLPLQDKYEKYAKMWSRLPLSLTTKIGPSIRKSLP